MRRSQTASGRLAPCVLYTATVVFPLLLGACAGAGRVAPAGAPAAERDLSDFVDVQVATVAIDLGHGAPLALLHDDWQKILPVWVGNEEALAIARARRGIPAVRPLTHDLFTDVIEGLGGTLEEVLVYDLREDLYYGILRIRVNGEIREFDARPSDGLALAVRTGARIRVDPHLFETDTGVDFISMEGQRPIVRIRGITVTRATDNPAEPDAPGQPRGVLVLHVTGDSPSDPVRRGDLILSVNGREVDSPPRFVEAVREIPDDVGLRVTLERDGEQLEVPLPPRARSPRRS